MKNKKWIALGLAMMMAAPTVGVPTAYADPSLMTLLGVEPQANDTKKMSLDDVYKKCKTKKKRCDDIEKRIKALEEVIKKKKEELAARVERYKKQMEKCKKALQKPHRDIPSACLSARRMWKAIVKLRNIIAGLEERLANLKSLLEDCEKKWKACMKKNYPDVDLSDK